MAKKILVNYSGSMSNQGLEDKKKSVADQLGVCPEDVIFLPGLSVSVVDLPDELTKAREKADKDAEAEREKAQEEQQEAELAAIKAQQEETAKAAEAAKPADATKPAVVDYDSWTADELHKEAATREIEGRSSLTTKADLIKALRKADRKG